MLTELNEYNQPISFHIKNYTPGDFPDIEFIEGNTVRIEKLNESHFLDLYELFGPKGDPKNFTYTWAKMFDNYESFTKSMKEKIESKERYDFTVIDKKTGKAEGTICLTRIDRRNRVIEVGSVIYSDKLKRTRQATESQFLVMQYVFDTLKYRRYEWKCDHMNESSRKAALRLGFTYEGTIRQFFVVLEYNHDMDYYSIIDKEWEDRKKRLQTWLSDDNFNEKGEQIQSLSNIKYTQ